MAERMSLSLLCNLLPLLAIHQDGQERPRTGQWTSEDARPVITKYEAQQFQVRFFNGQMGDDPRWLSVVDHPAQIVRTGRKHGPGLIILGMPFVVAFARWPIKMSANFVDSFNPNYFLRPRDMAGSTPGLENKVDRES